VLGALADVFTAGDSENAPSARSLHLAEYLDDYFGGEPPALQLQLKRALLMIEYGGYIWGKPRRRFTQLSPTARARYVGKWSRAEPGTRRLVVETFRRACLNAYFSDERTWSLIGYDGPLV